MAFVLNCFYVRKFVQISLKSAKLPFMLLHCFGEEIILLGPFVSPAYNIEPICFFSSLSPYLPLILSLLISQAKVKVGL